MDNDATNQQQISDYFRALSITGDQLVNSPNYNSFIPSSEQKRAIQKTPISRYVFIDGVFNGAPIMAPNRSDAIIGAPIDPTGQGGSAASFLSSSSMGLRGSQVRAQPPPASSLESPFADRYGLRGSQVRARQPPPANALGSYFVEPVPNGDRIIHGLLDHENISAGMNRSPTNFTNGNDVSALNGIEQRVVDEQLEHARRYLMELRATEMKLCQQLTELNSAFKLIRNEIERLESILNPPRAASPTATNPRMEQSRELHSFDGKHMLGPDYHRNMPPCYGPMVTVMEKVLIPIKEYPHFNFVGRILGPGGETIRQISEESGCTILIRGHDRRKTNYASAIGQDEPLHVRISASTYQSRAEYMVQHVKKVIEMLIIPVEENEPLKRKQLHHLARIRREAEQEATARAGLRVDFHRSNPMDERGVFAGVTPWAQSVSPIPKVLDPFSSRFSPDSFPWNRNNVQ